MPAVPSREIAVATLWQIASQCVMAVLSILAVKFVAVGLSRELVGAYNSAYGYLQLFGILADFGLYAVAVRDMGRAEMAGRVLGTFLRVRLIAVAVVIGGAVLLAWRVPQWNGTPLPIGVTLAALVPAFTLLAGVFRAAFQVRYRMHLVFIAEVGQRIVTVVLIGALLVLGVRESARLLDYELFLLFGGMGAFFLLLFSLFHARKLFASTQQSPPLPIGHFLRAALPYGIAYFCIALYRQFDVTLIALLRPDFQLQNAHYGFAVRLAEMAYLVPTFLLNAALPRFGGAHVDRQLLPRVFLALLVFGTVAALVAGVWATPIMRLLTSEIYIGSEGAPGADSALVLLALPMFFNSIILFCFYVLLASHAWRPLLKVLSLGALLSLVGNFFLIPRYGFAGAGVMSIGTHAILSIFLLFCIHGRWRALSGSSLFRWALFAIVLALFLFLARPFLVTPLHSILWLLLCCATIAVLLEIIGIRKTIMGNCVPLADVVE